MSQPPKGGPEDPTMVGGVPVYVVAQQAKPALLRQIKGAGAPREAPLLLAEMILGRAAESHLCIDSSAVSRRHAAIRRSDAGYTIEDLESGNGVFVNTERVKTALLKQGDTVQIGDALFVFQDASGG